MKFSTEHLLFVETKSQHSLKTKIYSIYNKGNLNWEIGKIKWFSQWRRYVLYPRSDVIFDSGCLLDIAGFIDELMLERKANEEEKELEK